MRCPGWPCDTQHAIDPKIWRFQSEKLQPVNIGHQINNLAFDKGARNICLTGGEPFMQNHDDLHDMINTLAHPSRWCTFEVFTNGSYKFPKWTKDPMIEMLFTMDWKLPGSGEQNTFTDVRTENALWLDRTDGIKFVVKDEDDLYAAKNVASFLKRQGCKAQFWVGRVWDTEITDQFIIEFIQRWKLDWKLNVQVHKFIWAPEARGV
jgi:7-carboxy-7-deazaguanine synthase